MVPPSPLPQNWLKRMNWKRLFNHWQSTGKLNQSERINTIAYLRGYQDFRYFVTYFFPHHCQFGFSRMHDRFFEDEMNAGRRGRRDVIAAPRGHAKTTFKVLFKALHAIVYGYEPFILVIGHSASEAQAKVQNILDELQSNQRLIAIFGELAPPLKHRSRKGFVTRTGIRVMAKSKGQQVRGLLHGQHRPSLILCDDIESLEGTLTPEQRLKTRNWFYKDVLKCGAVDGSPILRWWGLVCIQNLYCVTCCNRRAGFPESIRRSSDFRIMNRFGNNGK